MIRRLRANAVPLVIALGAFLLTSALMLRFHVYSELALLPSETETELRLVDEDAAYLDTSTWRTEESAEVVRRVEIDGTRSAGNDRWTAWSMSMSTASGSAVIAHTDRRAIVDRATGRAVNCCGEHVGGDRAVRQAGLVLHWPPGAESADHPFYDADVRSAPSMRLDGEEDMAGVATRRYVQTIEATQVPDSAREVPASALGDEGRRGTVTATRWLELERTYWIEPVSGRLVNAVEDRRETLRSEGGGERVLLDAELALSDAFIASFADDAESERLLLTTVRTWAPIGLGAAAALLLASAPVLRYFAVRADDDEE